MESDEYGADPLSSDSRQVIDWHMLDKNRFYPLTFTCTMAVRGCMYPLTVVKTRMQIQKQHTVYKGMFSAFSSIARDEGLRGLYKVVSTMSNPTTALLLLLVLAVSQADASDNEPVTCGSVIKLLSVGHNVRLHSHDVKYGSGSGQQSVTAVPDLDDNNSHWSLQGGLDSACARGTPIKCGAQVRLHHQTTDCYLHSHHFQSPLSHNQEVSCFGDKKKSDTGDNWEVICNSDVWLRDEEVRLKHVDTAQFLAITGHKYGRPIQGQYEISATPALSNANRFKTAEGMYIRESTDL